MTLTGTFFDTGIVRMFIGAASYGTCTLSTTTTIICTSGTQIDLNERGALYVSVSVDKDEHTPVYEINTALTYFVYGIIICA
jgi:Trk-type K+ transport system membrane component